MEKVNSRATPVFPGSDDEEEDVPRRADACSDELVTAASEFEVPVSL